MDQLQERLQSGDKTALKEIFDGNYTAVCATTFRYVQDKDLAQDLAQKVFIRLWEKRVQIVITSSLSAYLRRMAVNEALAWLRLKGNQAFENLDSIPSEVGIEDAEGALLHSELKDQIKLSILSLPPRCRTVFQLSRFEEMTYQQIANEMDISVKTVENQMGKALRLMKERLEPYLSKA